MKNIHPARLMAAAEALVALVAAFLPLSGEQVAALLGIVAVLTGERVVRKVKAS
jgi:tetrahydromethanopterin S-methyltransferase subunit C